MAVNMDVLQAHLYLVLRLHLFLGMGRLVAVESLCAYSQVKVQEEIELLMELQSRLLELKRLEKLCKSTSTATMDEMETQPMPGTFHSQVGCFLCIYIRSMQVSHDAEELAGFMSQLSLKEHEMNIVSR